MTVEQKRLNKQVKKKYYSKVIVTFLIIVLFLLILFKTCGNSSKVDRSDFSAPPVESTDTVQELGSGREDTALIPQNENVVVKDTVKKKIAAIRAASKKDTMTTFRADTLVNKTADDSVRNEAHRDTIDPNLDSVKINPDIQPCSKDTSELWVYPDPSGGLHRQKMKIRFQSNRQCSIKWRMKESGDWVEYQGGEIQIDKTGTLMFSGADSCGKTMVVREEYYEIAEKPQSVCPSDMAHVVIGDVSFCVDMYEWPNKKGTRPFSYISFYQAGDSCYSAGKRLCTADEWLLACSGPYSSRYPYGDKYEEHACVTTDTFVHVSGEKPECRSFFGLHDMSGNLLEWTDTRATENNSFFYVTGGFWDSGAKSSCSEKRYSYFTQNRHNPVGFRCCKSVSDKK